MSKKLPEGAKELLHALQEDALTQTKFKNTLWLLFRHMRRKHAGPFYSKLNEEIAKTPNSSFEKLSEFLTKSRTVKSVNNKNFNDLVELGDLAFKKLNKNAYNITRTQLFSLWRDANPHVFQILYQRDENSEPSIPIGYSCILPLKDEALEEYSSGRSSQFQLNQNDILSWPKSKLQSSSIVMQAIYVKPAYRTNYNVLASFYALIQHLSLFFSRDRSKLPTICAEAVLPPGEDALENFGFQAFDYTSPDDKKLYCIDFNNVNQFRLATKEWTEIAFKLMATITPPPEP